MVDVGAGIGTVTMDLVKEHTHLAYVVQDLPSTIAQAKEVGTERLYSGRRLNTNVTRSSGR